jgi:ABC-2 type transport system permease protein
MTLGKMGAFVVRSARLEWSSKLSFFGKYLGQLVQLFFIYFLARVVGSGSSLLGEYREHYFAFLLVGSLFSHYLTVGLRQLPILVREELLMGTLESILVTPTHTVLVLLGAWIWPQIEATLLLIVSLAIGGLALGADLSQANWLTALVVTALSLVCLSAWGILSVAFVIIVKRTDPLNWLIGATISFFSGVFFPTAVLPPLLRAVSYVFPLTYSLEMLRAGILQGRTLGAMGSSLWILALLTLFFAPLSLLVLRWAIRRARLHGSLAHY